MCLPRDSIANGAIRSSLEAGHTAEAASKSPNVWNGVASFVSCFQCAGTFFTAPSGGEEQPQQAAQVHNDLRAAQLGGAVHAVYKHDGYLQKRIC